MSNGVIKNIALVMVLFSALFIMVGCTGTDVMVEELRRVNQINNYIQSYDGVYRITMGYDSVGNETFRKYSAVYGGWNGDIIFESERLKDGVVTTSEFVQNNMWYAVLLNSNEASYKDGVIFFLNENEQLNFVENSILDFTRDADTVVIPPSLKNGRIIYQTEGEPVENVRYVNTYYFDPKTYLLDEYRYDEYTNNKLTNYAVAKYKLGMIDVQNLAKCKCNDVNTSKILLDIHYAENSATKKYLINNDVSLAVFSAEAKEYGLFLDEQGVTPINTLDSVVDAKQTLWIKEVTI